MYQTIYIRRNNTAWAELMIPGVGTVHHEFVLPSTLQKALIDYVDAQAVLRMKEIQANMTAKTNLENKENPNA